MCVSLYIFNDSLFVFSDTKQESSDYYRDFNADCTKIIGRFCRKKVIINVLVCIIWHVLVIFMYISCSEVNAGFFYKSAAEREKLVQAERAFTDQRVQKVIDFKKKVCDGTDKKFVLINQKASISDMLLYQAVSREVCFCWPRKRKLLIEALHWGLVVD